MDRSREGQRQGSLRGGAIPASLHRSASSSALIVGLRETGMTLNDEPVLRIDLLIGAEQDAPVHATAEGAVPLSALGDVVIGAEVFVRYDPGEPSIAVIDWDETAAH